LLSEHDDLRPLGAPSLLSEAGFRQLTAAAIAPSLLDRLAEVDALVAAAKSGMARLDEPAALRALAHAETIAKSALALPGVAAFYAEVELHIGVTAAQLGADELASAAFARAACLDPSRRLLAGEAAPEVVALATQAFERAASAPEGEVRIVVNAERARVFVDDVEHGFAPLRVRARSCSHVLRIEAQGYAPYAGVFELGEGQRPDQTFALLRAPHHEALSALEALIDAPHAARSAALQRAVDVLLHVAPEIAGVAWLEHSRSGARELLFACDRRGCRVPSRAAKQTPIAWPVLSSRLSEVELQRARAWLARAELASPPPQTPKSPALWQRWYVWSAVGAGIIGGALLIGYAARPEPARTLRVTVDPSALR
jgi:hypothetical protein